MSRLVTLVVSLLALVMVSCGPVEIRISKKEGVHALNGTLVARFDSSTGGFKCGDTITGEDSTQQYTVNTRQIDGACEFTFDSNVEVLANADYATIKEFKDAVRYVNRVEIAVQRLDFFDDSGARFDVEHRLREMEMSINGQQVLDIEQVKSLPKTVVLAGEALDVIKRAVKNREHCMAHIVARVVILDTDTPTGVRCEYESQPTFVVSSAEI